MSPYTRQDFDHSPMIVFYEMTRACDLACVHCRANAQEACDPGELSPGLARAASGPTAHVPATAAARAHRRRSLEARRRVRPRRVRGGAGVGDGDDAVGH